MNIFAIIMQLMSPDPRLIKPGSPGATHWVWLDRGQVKISARLFTWFGPILAIVFLTGFMALGSKFLLGAELGLWQTVPMVAASSFLGLFLLLSAYNAVVRAAFGIPRTPPATLPVAEETPEEAAPAEAMPAAEAAEADETQE